MSAEHPWASGAQLLAHLALAGHQQAEQHPGARHAAVEDVATEHRAGAAGGDDVGQRRVGRVLLEFEPGQHGVDAGIVRAQARCGGIHPQAHRAGLGPGADLAGEDQHPGLQHLAGRREDAVDAPAEGLGVARHAVRRAAVVEVELEAALHRTGDHGPGTQGEEFAEIEGLDTHGMGSGHQHNRRDGTPSSVVARVRLQRGSMMVAQGTVGACRKSTASRASAQRAFASITPHSTRGPELPAGSVL